MKTFAEVEALIVAEEHQRAMETLSTLVIADNSLLQTKEYLHIITDYPKFTRFILGGKETI